jgi:molybdopterin/thiamine biosynthesis adenylyltransferase
MARKRTGALMDTNNVLDFNRIEYLLNPEQLRDIHVTIIGLGSGGAPVCDHLTMNGIRKWDLYDPDTLSGENLVKHPRLRKDLNRPKAEIQKEWILDRNPNAVVNAFSEDIFESSNFQESVRKSDLVLSCPDTKSAREFISDVCVAEKKPFVTASVFRTGIGGEIYSYKPEETGCYKCLQIYSLLNNMDLSDDELGLNAEEREKIYGLSDINFRASGISMDIQMISLIQARMALSILLTKYNSTMPRLKSNWIIFGNRPAKGIFKSHFEAKQMLLRPQKSCNCTNSQIPEGVENGNI